MSPAASPRRCLTGLAAILLASGPLLATGDALAQSRVTFGSDAVVATGERVSEVVTMGGSATIDGHVTGDVVTMGGDVSLGPSGRVDGSLVTMGGDVHLASKIPIGGEVVTMGGEVHAATPTHGVELWPTSELDEAGPVAATAGILGAAMGGVFSWGLLFLLALGLHVLLRERFEVAQVAVVRAPGRTFVQGLALTAGTVLAIVVTAISIVGIPAAFVFGVGLTVAAYVGLAVTAAVLGVALPIEALRGKPVLQIAAGVGAMFIASLVPLAGGLAVFASVLIGIGALIVTRLGERPVPESPTVVSSAETAGLDV